ncbi:general secretion pathway protein GspB [Aliivibrio fischeri]|uniref:general secretion pathway protein GspB n=1 Tax=Aliivibrio fischeri TaxID=668 RepID=UPI001F1C13F8|nr:general secretion pathway protein GspB [Aliivibrio fischeri]MCE4936003.1 general secretion pathway protein GspB [Aliivibrio fischeri]
MLSKSISPVLIGAIIILPPLSLSAYIAWPYYQAQQQEIIMPPSTYTELSFPEVDTQKLPIQATKLALVSSVKNRNNTNEAPLVSEPETRMPVKNKSMEESGDFNVNELDLSGLSPELAARFESILNDPENDYVESEVEESSDTYSGVVALDKNAAQFIGRLPAMNFQTHNYTSKPSRRWVKVNGTEVNIGGHITSNISLLEINPRNVVVEFKGQKIEIPALYEWKG